MLSCCALLLFLVPLRRPHPAVMFMRLRPFVPHSVPDRLPANHSEPALTQQRHDDRERIVAPLMKDDGARRAADLADDVIRDGIGLYLGAFVLAVSRSLVAFVDDILRLRLQLVADQLRGLHGGTDDATGWST